MTTTTDEKMVYGLAEGSAQMVKLLGSKGAHVSEMARIGIPVPPGFVITTESSLEYYRLGRRFPDGLWDAVVENVRLLEQQSGKRFGAVEEPLIVSVRSGAAVSMPGMMDTILNLGTNDETVKGMVALMGDERPALDAYRRFIQGFANVVMGIEKDRFETLLDEAKGARGLQFDYELPPEALRELIARFQSAVEESVGRPVPQDPWDQLREAIQAVFTSWNNPRAITYREHQGIPHDLGTACVVMAMVFGNLGPDSGTGVLFSRSPATGEKVLYGEFLTNAQGEDVVAGVRTPSPISELAAELPQVYAQIEETARKLEQHYREVQDIEFTVERGKLHILQTRTAKRTPPAAVRIAVELVGEGMLSREEALGRVFPDEVTQVLLPRFDIDAKERAVQDGALMAQGIGGSPGAAYGVVAMDPDRAVKMADEGRQVLLVRPETSPDDVHGIIKANGVLTSRGGMTSHAAVVTRGLGKPCVVGCEELRFNMTERTATARGVTIREGDEISIDGTTGEVLVGLVPTMATNPGDLTELNTLLGWADDVRDLAVWANADTPEDAARARDYGAQGIGLCRTEHMFFAEDRLPHIQQALTVGAHASSLKREVESLRTTMEGAPASEQERLRERLTRAEQELASSADVEEYQAALERLEEFQTDDFYNILKVMEGLPVVIRLLDAPLHEFLPNYDDLSVEVALLQQQARTVGDHAPSLKLLRVFPWLKRSALNWLLWLLAKGKHIGKMRVRVDGKLTRAEQELASLADVEEYQAAGSSGAALEEKERTLSLVQALRESNPMLGHRGCRVGLTMPELYEMQVRAIVTAACRLAGEGHTVHPEVMIPIVSHVNELRWLRPRLEAVAEGVRKALGVQASYKFGTMIEVPRAALTASEIARETEFFSFGSNDLTQMTFGYSRDDAEAKFLRHYQENHVLPWNPFSSLDTKGVGRLMEMACQEGRAANPELEVGICGEHGGDPLSIAFCHHLGLNYVSCSPYRVPVARLAAAQSALGQFKPAF
jgi:pyruvate,orthophosphate dikinase